MGKSNLFIVCGFMTLAFAFTVTMPLTHADADYSVIFCVATFWLCWGWQLRQSASTVASVFGRVRGFGGFGWFFAGYLGLSAVRRTAAQPSVTLQSLGAVR